MLRRQRDLAREELVEMDRKQDELTLRAPADGAFVVPHAIDLLENFVKRGETLGYVMGGGAPTIRASVPASEIEEVRDRTLAVSMRFDEAPRTRIDRSTIAREAPQATHTLPSPALSSANGGPFTMDP